MIPVSSGHICRRQQRHQIVERPDARRCGFQGLDGFGASAPQKDLYEHFGFTPENVAARARALL